MAHQIILCAVCIIIRSCISKSRENTTIELKMGDGWGSGPSGYLWSKVWRLIRAVVAKFAILSSKKAVGENCSAAPLSHTGKIHPHHCRDVGGVGSSLISIEPGISSLSLRRRFELCIPRNQTARPCSKFPYSYICQRFLYSHLLCCSQIGRPIVGIYKSLTDIWM